MSFTGQPECAHALNKPVALLRAQRFLSCHHGQRWATVANMIGKHPPVNTDTVSGTDLNVCQDPMSDTQALLKQAAKQTQPPEPNFHIKHASRTCQASTVLVLFFIQTTAPTGSCQPGTHSNSAPSSPLQHGPFMTECQQRP